MGKSTSVVIPKREAYSGPKQRSSSAIAGQKTKAPHGTGGLMPARRNPEASLQAGEPPLVTATKEMHSIHSKDGISKKLALHGRPETHWQGVNENGWDSVVQGQAAPKVGQGGEGEKAGVKYGEVTLPNQASLMDETAKMVTYLNKDLPRLCRMQPEHLTEAEATSLSSFLKFARSIKELRLSKGDAAAAEELETWHDDIMPTGSVPANVRLDTAPAAGSKGPRPIAGARAGARSSKQAWQEKSYHAGGWAPPVETMGLDRKEVDQGPDIDMVLGDELRNMRYSLKVSGKAQTSDGGPGGKIALPRGYGGAAHNFNPANPPGGKDASVRGDKRPCFKRAKEPDYLMDSTQATLAELRDAERSIVSRKKLGVEEANKPREPTPGWYGNKGKEFSNDMETYMRNLNSQSRWKPKDEAHYQSALEKTGLDLGRQGTDVDNGRRTWGGRNN